MTPTPRRSSSPADVLDEVRDERYRQDEKWGEQNHRPEFWLAILMEEVGEVAHAVCEGGPKASGIEWWREQRAELVQVAAVAVGFVESLDRNELAVTRSREAQHGL